MCIQFHSVISDFLLPYKSIGSESDHAKLVVKLFRVVSPVTRPAEALVVVLGRDIIDLYLRSMVHDNEVSTKKTNPCSVVFGPVRGQRCRNRSNCCQEVGAVVWIGESEQQQKNTHNPK